MKRIVIIDDNVDDIDKIEFLLKKYFPTISIIGKFTDLAQGVEFLKKVSPDVLILDIEFGGVNSIEFLKEEKIRLFEVIFCTSHAKYTIDAFKLFAIGYLFKPFSNEEFISVLSHSFLRIKSTNNIVSLSNSIDLLSDEKKRIAIPIQGCVYFVNYSEIIRIESESNYSKIYLADGNVHLSSHGMKYYEEKLFEPTFLRVHKSHLINTNQIMKYYSDGTLVMKNGDKIPVARRRRNTLLEIFDGTRKDSRVSGGR